MKLSILCTLLLLSTVSLSHADDIRDAKALFGETPVELLSGINDIDNTDPWVSFMVIRFEIADTVVIEMVKSSGSYADAYLVFLMADKSDKSPAYVEGIFNKNRTRGWGYIAQLLDIKPGSDDFKKLKSRSDLAMAPGNNRSKSRGDNGDDDSNSGRGNSGKN